MAQPTVQPGQRLLVDDRPPARERVTSTKTEICVIPDIPVLA